MTAIWVKDRRTGRMFVEKVFGEWWIQWLYGPRGGFFRECFCKNPLVSRFVGLWQKRAGSKKKIAPFIAAYDVRSEDFEDGYHSFNDFFIRKLKKGVRPIANAAVVAPADGRYFFFEKVGHFPVKGISFTAEALIGKPVRAGGMAVARLCPSDYHRFHFPVDGMAQAARLIEGPLYSVNPVAMRTMPQILATNKRMVTEIDTDRGKVWMVEVGATCVGSMVQTFKPGPVMRGDEKGYFSFGGSSIVLLFEQVSFAPDLVDQPFEIYCQMGEALTKSL